VADRFRSRVGFTIDIDTVCGEHAGRDSEHTENAGLSEYPRNFCGEDEVRGCTELDQAGSSRVVTCVLFSL